MVKKTLCWLVNGMLLLLISSCQGRNSQPASTPAITADTGGLSAAEISTLNSLERVDEYPLYVMHYQGAYNSGAGYLPVEDTSAAWACSLFAALGAEDQKLYGRNFDWQFSPAVLLFTDPPDGYASVSMVDIAYLGFDNPAENLAELPMVKRQALLHTPYLPFDGVNEYGLAIGMAAVPGSNMPQDASKPDIDSLAVIREVLDHARTAEEAVNILGKYNLDWGSGPALHYLVADAGGNSALIEFANSEMVVLPNQDPWQLATNHLRLNAQGDGGCDRYAKIRRELTNRAGQLTLQEALQLLADVSQGGDYPTQWSIVYGIDTGEIQVVMGREYRQAHTFQFPLAGK